MPYFDTGAKYSIHWDGIPPHMLNPDIPTWRKWRELYGKNYDYMLYDVKLTTIDIGDMDIDKPVFKMWMANISKRIDVVAVKGNDIDIIEVTERAFLRAVGQAICYREIWKSASTMPGNVTSCILCNRADVDILLTCGVNNIKVIMV